MVSVSSLLDTLASSPPGFFSCSATVDDDADLVEVVVAVEVKATAAVAALIRFIGIPAEIATIDGANP